MRARGASLVAVAAALAVAACQSSPPPAARPPHEPGDHARAFDAARAWAHLEALAGFGPRTAGSEGNRLAREYIRAELERLGLETREQRISVRVRSEPGEPAPDLHEVRNVVAAIPGASGDVILLAAPFDSRRTESFAFLGVNDGASGAALLLEIARVLAAAPLPYTTWLAFLDGEAAFSPGAAAPRAALGSRGLAARLAGRGAFPRIRLAVVANRVCDPDLRIARDSLSHRTYREVFWEAAARLGERAAFPPDARFEPTDESHVALRRAGLHRVVALADPSFGGDEPPGAHAGTADDDLAHCAASSLATVGRVTLAALDTVSHRLVKVDRFVTASAAAEPLGLELLEESGEAGAGASAGEQGAAPDAGEAGGAGAPGPAPEPGRPSSGPAEAP